MGWVLLLFTVVPIAEMYLLLQVGGYLGALPTIAMVMATAVVGVALLRAQGVATLQRGVGRLNSGQVPAQEIAEGMMLGIAGALLLTPGFFTDSVGFLLLIPPVRGQVYRLIRARVTLVGMDTGMGGERPGPFGSPPPGFDREPSDRGPKEGPIVIDGEYERRKD